MQATLTCLYLLFILGVTVYSFTSCFVLQYHGALTDVSVPALTTVGGDFKLDVRSVGGGVESGMLWGEGRCVIHTFACVVVCRIHLFCVIFAQHCNCVAVDMPFYLLYLHYI